MTKFKPLAKWYIASPFTYKTRIPLLRPIMEFIRFIQISYYAAKLEHRHPDVAFILPITMSYVTQKLYPTLGGEWSSWAARDKTYIHDCDVMAVIMMKGWETSTGVKAEIEYCRERQIPIIYYSTGALEVMKVELNDKGSEGLCRNPVQ